MTEQQGRRSGDRNVQREAIAIPPDATIQTLAKAIWMEIGLREGSEGQANAPATKRSELWKRDKKEYLKLARKVVGRVGRLANRGPRDERPTGEGEADAGEGS